MRIPLSLFALAVSTALGVGGRPASVARAAVAARPAWEHRIVSGHVPVERGFGFDLERRLNAFGAQGFRFAAAVQPRPPLLAEEATVILARDTTLPAAVVEFAVLTADTAAELDVLAVARAREGFVAAAVTVTQGFRQPAGRRGDAIQFYDLSQHAVRYVAVLERATGTAMRPARIVEARTAPGGWDAFIAATRASFRVTQSLWLGPNAVDRTPERILFLLHDDGSGTAYETVVPATTPRTNLQDHIERHQKRGFDVASVWTLADRAEVLFVKPIGRRSAVPVGSYQASTWNMDETLDVQGNGRFVGGAYGRDGDELARHFVQDRRVPGYEYDGVTGVFPRSVDDRGQLGGVGFVGLGPPPETELACAACTALNERGAQGYRAIWAAVGPGYRFARRLEVILEAHRP